MYKILIKSKSSKEYYTPYQIVNMENLEEKINFETDSIEVLTETFIELLKTYSSSELKAVQELTTDILVNIED